VYLNDGDCGEAEEEFFVISKDYFFEGNKISQTRFQEYFETRLPQFAANGQGNPSTGGKTWKYNVGDYHISLLNLPNQAANLKVKLSVASEISRQVKGYWDSFDLNLHPAEGEFNNEREIPIVVEVEHLKTVKRSAGADFPPDDSYFRSDVGSEGEGVVTTAVTNFFAQRDKGWCQILGPGEEEPPPCYREDTVQWFGRMKED
jgi:hypothetical protein